MTADDPNRPGFSLRRWSQKKRAASAPPAPAADSGAPVLPLAATPPAVSTPATPPSAVEPAAPLPPVDTLSFESDFTAFMQPKVDESLKRLALKKLFSDPRFNVMDGLDVYIDDYSKPDPLPPGMLEQLVQGRYLFDPPKTRVNAQGVVEDVPPDEVAAADAAAAATPAIPAVDGAAQPGADSPAGTAGNVAPAELPAPAQASLDIPSSDAPQPVPPSPRDPARK